MLDFGGEECKKNNREGHEYNKDLCTHEAFEKKALALYGCTAPFGPNKDNICTDEKNASKVLGLYRDVFEKHIGNCDNPCSFITTRAIKTGDKAQILYRGKRIAYLAINFNENIKVTTGHQLYSTLSLIAEIGGYVGLFLGVSVKQITDLMDMLFNWIDTFCNQPKPRNY